MLRAQRPSERVGDPSRFARESFFAVFDADRPSAGPRAKAWLGQATPITFHGTFIPGTAAQFEG